MLWWFAFWLPPSSNDEDQTQVDCPPRCELCYFQSASICKLCFRVVPSHYKRVSQMLEAFSTLAHVSGVNAPLWQWNSSTSVIVPVRPSPKEFPKSWTLDRVCIVGFFFLFYLLAAWLVCLEYYYAATYCDASTTWVLPKLLLVIIVNTAFYGVIFKPLLISCVFQLFVYYRCITCAGYIWKFSHVRCAVIRPGVAVFLCPFLYCDYFQYPELMQYLQKKWLIAKALYVNWKCACHLN